MTGIVKWIGQRPQGSNKTFIGVEAAEEVMDPGKNLQFLMITVLGNRDTYQLRIHRWYPFSQHLNSLKKCCEKGALLRKGGNCSEKWEKL